MIRHIGSLFYFDFLRFYFVKMVESDTNYR